MTKTILLVDDSVSIRELVGQELAGAGYRVIVAVDGLDGLDKAPYAAADLVISDLNMPQMIGYTFINELRNLPGYRGVPVIFLTNESDIGLQKIAKATGAKAWITKPFQPAYLLAVVGKIIGPGPGPVESSGEDCSFWPTGVTAS